MLALMWIGIGLHTNIVYAGETKIYDNGLWYKLNDDASCSVCAYQDETYDDYIELSGEITVPSTINFDGITYVVTGINESCFYGNDKITKINLPSTITKIERHSFRNMTNLTTLNIPGNVQEITGNPFINSNKLTNLIVSSSNNYFSSDASGNIYDKQKTKLLFVSPSVTNIVIPEGMEIGEDAFWCNNYIQEVTLPSTMTIIPDYEFYDCEGLRKVNLSEGVLTIGERAFSGCSSLSTINFPKSLEYIDEYGFAYCTSLSQITLPSKMKKIGWASFINCSSLNTINFPAKLEEIEGNAFRECTSLTKVTLPSGIKTIGWGAFQDCTSLKNINFPEGLEVIEGNWLGYGAFRGCSNLTEITLPSTLKSIGDGAFVYCSNLNKVTILSKDVEIGSSVFSACSYPFVLYGYSNSTVQNYVKEWSGQYDYQFYFSPLDGSGLYNYREEESDAEINIPVAKNTTLNISAQKCMVKVTSSSIAKPTVSYMKSTNSKAKAITIPDAVKVDGITYKVTGIASNAFAGNKKLTKVTIGKNVTSIGKSAFKKCTKLKYVTIKSTSLKTIGSNAFNGDKNLKTIIIKSKKLTSKRIGKNAFKGTNKKLVIKVPKSKVKSYKKFLTKKGNTKVRVKKG